MTWLEAHLMQNTDSEIHADQNARAGVGGAGPDRQTARDTCTLRLLLQAHT